MYYKCVCAYCYLAVLFSAIISFNNSCLSGNIGKHQVSHQNRSYVLNTHCQFFFIPLLLGDFHDIPFFLKYDANLVLANISMVDNPLRHKNIWNINKQPTAKVTANENIQPNIMRDCEVLNIGSPRNAVLEYVDLIKKKFNPA